MSGLPPYIFRSPLDLLEALCQELELTETQRANAERSYKAVGEWLNYPDSAIARYTPEIYAQGSIVLGTTVKPHNRADFDVDLVCSLYIHHQISALELFRFVDARLREHATYAAMISRMNRCVRLDYEPDYHLDITPGMPHQHFAATHIYVPDRALSLLKDSNPKGYIEWFRSIAAMQPNIRHLIALANDLSNRAAVEPLRLEQSFEKRMLQRIVQILKRHRDLHFETKPDLAVISVIITTLAAKSYHRLLGVEFDSVESFVSAVVHDLPNGIERRAAGQAVEWWIPNPSSPNENFAEKWNREPRKKAAFDQWYLAVIDNLDDALKPNPAEPEPRVGMC